MLCANVLQHKVLANKHLPTESVSPPAKHMQHYTTEMKSEMAQAVHGPGNDIAIEQPMATDLPTSMLHSTDCAAG